MTIFPANLPALRAWLAEALTVFANGCVSGLGGGLLIGAGAGAVSNVQAVPLDHGSLVALSAMLLSAAGNGFKRVIVWHDSHAIPNPFIVTPEPEPAPAPLQPTDPKEVFAKL